MVLSGFLQARKHFAFVSEIPVLRQYRLLPEQYVSTPGQVQSAGLIIFPLVLAHGPGLQFLCTFVLLQRDGMQPSGTVLSLSVQGMGKEHTASVPFPESLSRIPFAQTCPSSHTASLPLLFVRPLLNPEQRQGFFLVSPYPVSPKPQGSVEKTSDGVVQRMEMIDVTENSIVEIVL